MHYIVTISANRILDNRSPDIRSKIMRTGYWATDGRTQGRNVTTNTLVLMKRLILAPSASWRSGLLSGSTCITIQLHVKEMTCACAWRCYLLEWCDVMQSGTTVPTFWRTCCPHLPWRWRLHVYPQRRCEMKHGLNFFSSGSTAHEGPSASFRINFQASLSLAIFLQPRTPIFFRSFSTSPNHLFLGFPKDLFPSGLFLKNVVGTGRVKIRPCFYKLMKSVLQSWDSGSIPWLSVCDLWWIKWRWVCFYPSTSVFPSVSFYQCPTLIASSIVDDIQSQKLTASLKLHGAESSINQ